MKISFQIFTIVCTALLFGNACAQSNTVDKILKTSKDVQKADTALGNTINTISGFFNKKNKKKSETDITLAKSSSASQPATDTIPENTFSSVGNLKAGENIDGVKQLDADKMGSFIKGAAIVQKINSTALIDASGNFIIPYNQFEISYIPINYDEDYLQPVGIFAAVKDYTVYLLLPNGKILFSSKNTDIAHLQADSKYVYVEERLNGSWNNPQIICIDEEGNKHILKNLSNGIREGLFYSYSEGKPGYYNIKNELVIPSASYNDVSNFSEGLALVGKKDEFGQMKYGYIDKKGKVVIPLIYTRKPDNFSSGLAKVLAKGGADFNYAFINKEGKIVYKNINDDIQKYGEFSPFKCGIAVATNHSGGMFVMDTTGKIITKDDFLGRYGIKNGRPSLLRNHVGIVDCYCIKGAEKEFTEIIFTQERIKGVNTGSVNAGLIDLKTGKMTLPALFYTTGSGLRFDPVSGLAYAEIRDANKHVLKEGYIKRDGMFVMLKGEPST